MKIKDILTEITHLFFPQFCVVCKEKLLPSEKGVCLSCIHKLPKTNNFAAGGNKTEVLLAGRFPFERVASFCVFSKGGTLQPIIHELKYRGKKELGILLGRLYGTDLADSDFIKSIDFILPVPLHPKKEKQRGYNQAEMIAIGLSEATKVPVNSKNLYREIYNPTQTRKSKTQRWENVEGIFSVRNPEEFAGKYILLVDDIITTGSTLEACAHTLLQCEGIKISIATIGEVL